MIVQQFEGPTEQGLLEAASVVGSRLRPPPERRASRAPWSRWRRAGPEPATLSPRGSARPGERTGRWRPVARGGRQGGRAVV